MIWLAYFIFGFLVLRFMVSISNLITRQWLRRANGAGDTFPEAASPPLVSVLIPARNEEKKIGSLLNDLFYQDYKNLEIIVYDDLSEDNTARVVSDHIKKDSRIRLIEGRPLPYGWLGKSHGCHQLSLAAKGNYLLFLDADVRVKSSLISSSLAHMHRYRLDLFSIFPKQEMHTFGEKITVPVMNWILVGLLPLILTRISTRPSLSAANGQFMLFRAGVYHSSGFHKEVKEILAEDIEIFRISKKKGLRTHTVLSNVDITCRMYGSWSESLAGFSRNVPEFFGGHTWLAVLFALITTLGFIPVLFYLPRHLFLAFFVLIVIHRATISFLSRQPLVPNLLLAPLQQIAFCIMIITAINRRTRYALMWKGRNVYRSVLKPRMS